MRLLMITSFPIPGDYDGTAMLPIKILRALRRRGIEVAHAHLRARPPLGRPERGEFEGIPSFSLPPAWWVSGLRRVAREFPFDLVHAQHWGGASRAYPACRLNRWPMVYEIHSLLGDEVERDRLGRGPAFQINLALERRACRYARAVIALGEPVKRVVVEEKGVPEDRVSVIYPGIDLGEYEKPSAPVTIPGIEPEHEVVMYIGSLVHPNQGVPMLVQALTSVFAARPLARAVLVGGPAEAGETYKRRLGAHADRLVVLSNQTPEAVVALSRRADVLVHPRLPCRENYSVQSKIAVYLASGRPIVATDFGDYQHLLGQTGAGRLTAADPQSLAGGIVEVLSDPELADRLARASGPVAREFFGMDRNIDRYLDVYERALAVPALTSAPSISAAPGV